MAEKANNNSVDIFDALALNVEAEQEGRWIEDFPVPGAATKVARMDNVKYARDLQRRMQAAQEDAREAGEDLTPECTEELMTESMARHILTDWRGWVFQGSEVQYSPEKAEEILKDPRMRELRNRIWSRSNSLTDYLAKNVKADAKN